jgi:peroxiredoxin
LRLPIGRRRHKRNADQGKPGESRGRKATGLKMRRHYAFIYDSGVAGTRSLPYCHVIALFIDFLIVNTSAMMTKALLQILAVLLCTSLISAAGAAPLVIGEPAPDFALPNLQGKNLRLSEYRSDVVVLNFWAAWCNRCSDSINGLNSIYQAHQVDGLQVLAVGVDFSNPKTAAFVGDLQAAFPLLADDSQNTVSKAYDLGTLPLTLVIDREGNVRFVHEGFDKDTGQQIATQVAALLAE